MANCPHCRKPVKLVKESPNGNVGTNHPAWLDTPGRFTTAHTFASAADTPAFLDAANVEREIARQQAARDAQFTEARREAPARPATMESDVLVPGAQALATGIALLVPGVAVAVWAGWPWWAPLAISAGGSALMWAGLLNSHHKMLWAVETITGRDIDGDGHTGQPQPAPDQTIRLEIAHPDHHGRINRQQYLELPTGVTRNHLRQFATGYQVHGLTTAYWTGSAGTFSRGQYEQFIGTLMEAGIVTWKNPNNPNAGRTVTRGGRAALAHIANEA